MVVRDSLAIARRILRRTTNMTNMARLWTYAEPLSWSNHKWFDCSKTNFTGPKASEGPDATSKSTLWILSDHHMLPTKCLEVGGWWNETDLCACHPIILFSWPSRHPFLKSFHQRGTNRMGDANPNAKENKIPLGMLGCEIWVRSLAPGGGCWFPSGFDWMLVHTSALSKKNVQHRCHQEIFDSAWQAALCRWSITWRRFVNFKGIPGSKTVCLSALQQSIWQPSKP